MKPLLCFALLIAAPVHAAALKVVVEPQPIWAPSPTPTLSPLPTLDPLLPPVTPDPAATPTPTPTLTQPVATAPQLFKALAVLPFEDRRVQKLLSKGRAKFQDVEAEAQGLTQQAAAWSRHPYSGMSLLWQRQLAYSLASSGVHMPLPLDPVDDETLALGQVADQGADYALSGKLKRLDIEKRGADMLIGTAFSGFKYTFRLEADLKLVSLSDRKTVWSKKFEYETSVHEDTVMGAPDKETFPLYFREGIRQAAEALAAEPKLRQSLGHAVFTPTPTATATPTKAPTRDPKARTATVTPTPTPASYYMNPKTGKAVNPAWNFDPEDGTARKDFVLVDSQGQPIVTPTPTQLP